MDLDYSSMSRYVSPINPAVFPHLSIVLLGIGLFFTAWFFVYEVSIIHYYHYYFYWLIREHTSMTSSL